MPYALGAVALIVLGFMPLKFHFEGRNRLLELVFKGAATAVALGFALYRCVDTGFADTYAVWICAGLALSVTADVVLELCFPAGGALFFLAHVAYVAGICARFPVGLYTALVAVAAGAALLPYLYHYRAKIDRLLMVGLTGYALALSLLLGAALPQPFLRLSRQTVLLALGAALFVASDMTLCRNTVLGKGKRDQFVSLLMYYMGQLLLALSVFPA